MTERKRKAHGAARPASMPRAQNGGEPNLEQQMRKMTRRRNRSIGELALRGGAAGVVAGLAVTLIEREVLARIAGGARHRSAWDDLAARGLARAGLEVGDRGRIATGIASQLAYSGALGAAYAVLREQTRDSRAGRILLDGALTYAASLVFPDVPTPARRGRRLALRKKVVEPVNPAAAFSRVTAMALGVMAR
jgi:hypothetical protein